MLTCGNNSTIVISNGRMYAQTSNDELKCKLMEFSNVTCVASGYNHTAFVANRHLYTFGINNYGQLCYAKNEATYNKFPHEVFGFNEVTLVSCGHLFTAFICGKKIYTCGTNLHGQLGRVCTCNEHKNAINMHLHDCTPKHIRNFNNVTAISCGDFHLAFINNGCIYACGSNADGQLGQKYYYDKQCMPTRIATHSDVVSVACGLHHTAYVCNDGSLYTFGYEAYGLLGHPENEDQLYPKKVNKFDNMNVTNVVCGNFHTIVICDDKLYVTGINTHGQLGTGDYKPVTEFKYIEKFSKISAIACNNNNSAVVARGCLYVFGWNKDRQLYCCNEQRLPIPRMVEDIPKIYKQVARYWYPLEFLTDSYDYDELDDVRSNVAFVGCLLVAHSSHVYNGMDDILCDVLSYSTL